jgi:hypothetical protein
MSCNIATPGGYMGQIGRNLKLEPILGKNSRSKDGDLRNEELHADKVQIGLGAGGAALFGLGAIGIASKLKTFGATGAVMAGVLALGGGYLGATAIAGYKNLHAKLDCGDDGTNKPPTGPAPTDPTTPTEPGKPAPVVYSHTVVRGDTLTDIAECNDVPVEDLYTYNQDTIGDNGNRIMPGMKLIIPPADYKGPGATFEPTGPRSLPKNQCVAPIPGSALEPCK